MASLAIVSVIGRCGGDPETRYSPAGKMSVSVSVAVNKRKPDGGDSTTWFKCSVWGTQAETIDRLVQQGALRKGSEVFVSGSLEAREYQDRNGQTRQSLDVFVNTLQLTGSREANDNPNAGTEPKDGVPF